MDASSTQTLKVQTGKIIKGNDKRWSLREKVENHEYCVDNIAIEFLKLNEDQIYKTLSDFDKIFLK